jgi:hypothetical protein
MLCLVGGAFYKQSPMRPVSKSQERKSLIPNDNDGVWDDDVVSVAADEEMELITPSLSTPTATVGAPADKSGVQRRVN